MRLTSRLFLLISVLITLTVGMAVAVTWWWSARIGREAITERLIQGDAVRERQDRALYSRLELVADVFVADANLIAYVAEAQAREDTASILDLLTERQPDLGFDFAVVTDPDGYLIVRTDRPEEFDIDLAEQPLISRALDEYRSSGLWVEGEDEVYRAVVIPLVQGGVELLGYFATGYRIRDADAEESRALDGSEVTLISPNGRVLATTLPHANLAASVSTAPGSDPVFETQIGDETWLVHRALLEDGSLVRLTAASLREETAPFRKISNALALGGLGAALLGFLLTYGVARRLTRPFARFVETARAARRGDYSAELPTERSDEVGELGREFAALLAELREKREMEEYVAELSRNLPDPGVSGSEEPRTATHETVSLLLAEYRRHAAGGDDAAARLAALEADVRLAAGAVADARGRVLSLGGHRVLAVFEGAEHARRALRVAIDLGASAGSAVSPAVVIATEAVTLGTIEWGGEHRDAVCGRGVQLLDSLLREAAPGEVLLPTTTRDFLAQAGGLEGLSLFERQGVTTALRFCWVEPTSAAHLPTMTFDTEQLSAVRNDTPAGPVFAPGEVVADRFEILGLAGSGGMGAVYRARDRKLGDVVALKTLHEGAWSDPAIVERLKQEIKIARRITHPHVLRVYDLGEVNGIPFISMEYIRGVTLRHLMEQSDRLPFSAAKRLGRQICQGLEAVHAAGILHLDMKPENVLLEPTGNARLMDFGIAAPVRDQTVPGSERKELFGTPYYMAPEQLNGGTLDGRVDIFATGILLFELFTGSVPFRRGETLSEVIRIKLEEAPEPASSSWPDVPQPVAELLSRCLEKDPEKRFPHVGALLAALDRT